MERFYEFNHSAFQGMQVYNPDQAYHSNLIPAGTATVYRPRLVPMAIGVPSAQYRPANATPFFTQSGAAAAPFPTATAHQIHQNYLSGYPHPYYNYRDASINHAPRQTEAPHLGFLQPLTPVDPYANNQLPNTTTMMLHNNGGDGLTQYRVGTVRRPTPLYYTNYHGGPHQLSPATPYCTNGAFPYQYRPTASASRESRMYVQQTVLYSTNNFQCPQCPNSGTTGGYPQQPLNFTAPPLFTPAPNSGTTGAYPQQPLNYTAPPIFGPAPSSGTTGAYPQQPLNFTAQPLVTTAPNSGTTGAYPQQPLNFTAPPLVTSAVRRGFPIGVRAATYAPQSNTVTTPPYEYHPHMTVHRINCANVPVRRLAAIPIIDPTTGNEIPIQVSGNSTFVGENYRPPSSDSSNCQNCNIIGSDESTCETLSTDSNNDAPVLPNNDSNNQRERLYITNKRGDVEEPQISPPFEPTAYNSVGEEAEDSNNFAHHSNSRVDATALNQSNAAASSSRERRRTALYSTSALVLYAQGRNLAYNYFLEKAEAIRKRKHLNNDSNAKK